MVSFDVVVDGDYVLSSTSMGVSLYVYYLFVVSKKMSCGHCDFGIVDGDVCVEKCGGDSFAVDFGEVKYCRGCSGKLNLEVDVG